MAHRFSCYALERIGVIDMRFCCDSCHEDEDMGYDMVERDLPDTDDYLAVCCRIELDDLGDLRDLHAALLRDIQR